MKVPTALTRRPAPCPFASSSFSTCTHLAMSARISLARPAQATGGYQPDPHGFGNSRPSNGYRAANPDDPLEKIRAFAHAAEENVDIYAQPLKPHLPAIGRFLIVITFLEDSLRILSQWSDQLWYLQKCVSRRHRCLHSL